MTVTRGARIHLPDLPAQDTDWMALAECTGHDPETWFPVDETSPAADQATAICGSCLVRDDCHTYALAAGVEGIWAGTTTAQRSRTRTRTRVDLWSDTDTDMLRHLWQQGYNSAQIGQVLGRATATVRKKANRMGLEPHAGGRPVVVS